MPIRLLLLSSLLLASASSCAADAELAHSESRTALGFPSLAAGTAIAAHRCARTGGGPAEAPPRLSPSEFSTLILILRENWEFYFLLVLLLRGSIINVCNISFRFLIDSRLLQRRTKICMVVIGETNSTSSSRSSWD